MRTLLLFAAFCCLYTAAVAQQDSAKKTTVQPRVSINYNSNLHYYGRTDSLQSSGIYPMAELWVNDQWYANAAPIFVHNQLLGTNYAGTVATLGYLKATAKNVVHLYALKPFYKEEAALVQAALKAQAGLSYSWLSKVVNLTVGGDVRYSQEIDYAALVNIDHLVRIQKGKSVLLFDPTLSVQGGTQNLLKTYRQKSGTLFPREQVVTEQGKRFRLLAWEASVPVILVRGKTQLLLTPAYVSPQNLLGAAENGGVAERGKPLFYTTAGFKYSF